MGRKYHSMSQCFIMKYLKLLFKFREVYLRILSRCLAMNSDTFFFPSTSNNSLCPRVLKCINS